MSDYSSSHGGLDIHDKNLQKLMEKALETRSLSYYSWVKSQLLTRTIIDVDHRRRRLKWKYDELSDSQRTIIEEKAELESTQLELMVAKTGLEKTVAAQNRKLRETIAKLELERDRIQAYLNIGEAVIIELDQEGKLSLINRHGCDILNYDYSSVIGEDWVDLMVSENQRERTRIELDRLLAGGPRSRRNYDTQIQTSAGELRHFTWHFSTQTDAEGQVTGLLGSGLDNTERMFLESQLSRSQRMEAIGQLTGGIAHDFNNLLAVMMSNSELLEDSIGEDEKARGRLHAIQQAVDRGASLTNRLLAFSRKQTLLPMTVNVPELIVDLVDMLHRTLGETVNLKIDFAPNPWSAAIDPHQFENALINLAINARDAMPKGGALILETANMTLDETYAEQHSEVTPGDYVTVAVSDTGTGMTPEVLEKVFEPFFTTKGVGEGSGLGLSMVYGFVKQSNGHITLYSEEGHGTTVKLYMPRSEGTVAKEYDNEPTLEFEQRSERILVVEDDDNVRDVPVDILRNQGYEVVEARDGKEAVEHLKTGPPFDLVFTDFGLPGGMNGIEVADKAKQLQPDIKVLYTTGYVENAIDHEGQLTPGATLVSKPYRRAELLEKIRAVLDNEGD